LGVRQSSLAESSTFWRNRKNSAPGYQHSRTKRNPKKSNAKTKKAKR